LLVITSFNAETRLENTIFDKIDEITNNSVRETTQKSDGSHIKMAAVFCVPTWQFFFFLLFFSGKYLIIATCLSFSRREGKKVLSRTKETECLLDSLNFKLALSFNQGR